MSPFETFLIIVVAIFVLIVIDKSVYIVRQFERGVITQFGAYKRTVDPGLTFILPFIQSLTRVDMRETVLDVLPQEVITKDNAVVRVDAVVYYEVTDPFRRLFNVSNFQMAAVKLAQTNLRNLIGDLELDEALTSRERINAMSRQMKAERDKRAAILEAEGTRQSQILQAEGQRQAAILEAEGKAEAIRKVAEAERFREVTVAEGEAQAIQTVFSAIHAGRPTHDLLAVKYLETLGRIANGKATKIFLPIEATGVLSGIAAAGIAFEEGRKTGQQQPEE